MTFEDGWVVQYLFYCKRQKELSDKTIMAYELDLRQVCSYLKENEAGLSKQGISEYLTYIHGVYRQKTVKRKIASLKAFLRYLEFEDIIQENPMHRLVTKFKEETVLPRTIPAVKIERLLSYMYEQQKNVNTVARKELLLRDIVIVELLFATGIRISELCNLTMDALDADEGVLRIRGKGAKERYIQIGNADVLRVFKKYLDGKREAIETSGYVFFNRYGVKISEQAVRHMIKRYAEQAKLGIHITPHMFRHAFATLLLEEDVDIRYIQRMLGHSSIATTQIYTYVTSAKQMQILQTKHPRNKMNVDLMEPREAV